MASPTPSLGLSDPAPVGAGRVAPAPVGLRMAPPAPVGVGMVYFPALTGIYQHCAHLLDLLEVEPQTLWQRQGDALLPDPDAFDQLARLPGQRLAHGVGMPLADVVHPDPQQARAWVATIERIQPRWVSEHLAFMRVPTDGREHATSEHSGFLLPPLQCDATVALAVQRIRDLQRLSGRPVAFENPTNYLRPQPGEINDGAFLAQIARQSDCGLLLDVHNLYCNQRNGRQTMQAALRELPLDRVWELHLAGGEARDGFWLDAHSGGVPPEVMALCEEWIPRLPHLRAIVFEIMPDYVAANGISADDIAQQLQALHALWALRPGHAAPRGTDAPAAQPAQPDPAGVAAPQAPAPCTPVLRASQRPVQAAPDLPAQAAPDLQVLPAPDQQVLPEPDARTLPAPDAHTLQTCADWQRTLGSLVNQRRGPPSPVWDRLADDAGVSVLQTLTASFRWGTVAEGLALSWRLLVLALGQRRAEHLLDDYCRSHWPQPVSTDELAQFARFLEGRLDAGRLPVQHLRSVLAFEMAQWTAHAAPEPVWVRFEADPLPLLTALAEGRWPEQPPAAGCYELEVPRANAARTAPA